MRLEWSFETSDIDVAKRVVEQGLTKRRLMLESRQRKNVERGPLDLSQERMWFAHLMCLLTSAQRSGPDSPVNRLLGTQPFPLSLVSCEQTENLELHVNDCLKKSGGIRFTTKIPRLAAANFNALVKGHAWNELSRWRDRLLAARMEPPDPSQFQVETDASRYVAQLFAGFGPKQSRNFWQSLGLTRYSSVLDSRVIGWMRDNLGLETGLLTSQGLNDEDYYLFISKLVMNLCDQAGVLPCMFDAAVFDSYDIDKPDWKIILW